MPDPRGTAGSSEAAEIRAALVELRRLSGLPVAFGGLLDGGGGRLRITELNGTATGALRGLVVAAGSGLGGKSLVMRRPLAVHDYPAARTISHEYDAEVGAECLRAVLAVPLVVRHRVRGVLYGALRERVPLGDRVLSAAAAAAREAEQALAVRDEARRLLSLAGHRQPAVPAAWEEVRAAHAELRALAPRIADPELRGRLLAACGRLAAAASGPDSGAGAAADPQDAGSGRGAADAGGPGGRRSGPVRLAPRELDVLACVASGATNAAAAERLGLRTETVRCYLRSAMRKLGVHTRLAAVVAARRAGLLP